MSQRAFEARQTRDTLTARDVEAELDLGQLCDVQTPADLVAAGEVEGGDGRGRRGGTALSLGLAARGADVGTDALGADGSLLARKAQHRRSLKVRAEAPAHLLRDVSSMPRREAFAPDADGDEQHRSLFARWADGAVRLEKQKQKTACQYEKFVGAFNNWSSEKGFAPFAAWSELPDGSGLGLVLLVDAGVPRVPETSAVLK